MEVALRIDTKERTKKGVRSHYPKGSVVAGRTSLQTRVKWIEILGELMAPWRRAEFARFPYYSEAAAIWKTGWFDAWVSLERSRSINGFWDATYVNQIWSEITGDGSVFANLPNDPRGDVHCTQVWQWGIGELSKLFVVAVDSDDFGLLDRAEYSKDSELRFGPLWGLDYENDLLLSADSLSKINDRRTVFYPRYNRVVPKSLFKDLRNTDLGFKA